jgi:hypothetical protein
MVKIRRKNMTEKQLANLNGVKNRKPKALPVTEPELSKEQKKRRDWEHNHAIITSEFIRLLGQKQKLPSYAELGKALGFDEQTIRRHLEDYSIEDTLNKLKIGNEVVLLNLFKLAATGKNEKIIRLYFECTGLLKNKIDITSGGNPINTTTPGVITLDPTQLPTDLLKALIEQGENNNV